MADIAKFLEGGAFGVLNDILSTFHSEDGYAEPNRFECLILPPMNAVTISSIPGAPQKRASLVYGMSNDRARAVSMSGTGGI